MLQTPLTDTLADNPLIAAVKSEAALARALESEAGVIFLLFGDLLNISSLTEQVHRSGKLAFVHLDLIEGLASREVAVEFVARNTAADGIISTKAALTRRAKALGLLAIQRFFLLDSLALNNLEHLAQDSSDAIEVLPGLMPQIISWAVESTGKPVIAGGLIRTKEDVTSALGAGAIAVSSTNPEVWAM